MYLLWLSFFVPVLFFLLNKTGGSLKKMKLEMPSACVCECVHVFITVFGYFLTYIMRTFCRCMDLVPFVGQGLGLGLRHELSLG